MMSEYRQPFYIPFGKGRVNLHTGIRGGYYLPPIDPTYDIDNAPVKSVPVWEQEQWKVIEQLRAQILYLRKQLLEQPKPIATSDKQRRRGIAI